MFRKKAILRTRTDGHWRTMFVPLAKLSARAVAVIGIGDNISEAEAVCEQVVREIPGPFFHRTDIGTDSVIAGRVDHMKRLRSA